MILALMLLAAAPARVELIIGGDVIPHPPVKSRAAKLGWEHVFAPLAGPFEKADFAIVNLETPVSGNPKAVTGGLLFDAPPALLAGLVSVGVDVATFANNHGLDQHREGIVATRAALTDAGLLSTGADVNEEAAWQPLVLERNGMRIGLFAFTRFLNRFHNLPDPKAPHVPLVHYADDVSSGGYTEAQLLKRVSAAAGKCDALIVIPHWGEEYRAEPRPEDRRLAVQLVEAGAIAIVGHHPHVLQPVETVARADGGEAVVAFSLGNLVSNQDVGDAESPKRDGLLVQLTLERATPEAPVKMVKLRPVPVWMEHGRNVQVLVIDDQLDALEARSKLLEEKDDRVSVSEAKVVKKRLAQMSARRERILRMVQSR